MSVYKRRDRWVIDFYPQGRSGKRIRVTAPKEYTEEMAQQYEELFRKQKITPNNETMAALFTNYLQYYKVHRSPSTYKDLEGIFRNSINPILGSFSLDKIKTPHIEFYARQRIQEVGPRTVTKELNYIGGFFSWCEKNKYIESKPRIEKLPYKRPVPIVLTPQEVHAILEALEEPYKGFCIALYTLGLRFAEAANLTWQNVDLNSRILKVVQKGGSWKILPINNIMLEALQKIPGREGLIFRSKITGEKIVDIRRPLENAKKKTGITKHVNPHLFRHSIATHFMAGGVNLRIIQGYLGHADLGTTEVYTHVSAEYLTQASNMIPKLLNDATTVDAEVVEIPERTQELESWS